MNVQQLCMEAAKRFVWFKLSGEDLGTIRPKSLTPDFAEALRVSKGELREHVSRTGHPVWQSVAPADLPLDPVTPEPTPLQREAVTANLERQIRDGPPSLAKWLVTRENAYYDGPGRGWDCRLIAYAAARDAMCWQLSLSETEVWQSLEIGTRGTERTAHDPNISLPSPSPSLAAGIPHNQGQSVEPGSRPTTPDEFLGKTREIARAVFDKCAEVKTGARLEPLARAFLLPGPPGVGKTTVAELIGTLADHSSDVEQINGQSCAVELVREWQEQARYCPMSSIRVQIVDEIDAASPAAFIELRTYLDKLPRGTVFIATTNEPVSNLPNALQSRFEVYNFEPVPTDEIAQWLVSAYEIPTDQALRFAGEAKGNVRDAKAKALRWLDSKQPGRSLNHAAPAPVP